MVSCPSNSNRIILRALSGREKSGGVSGTKIPEGGQQRRLEDFFFVIGEKADFNRNLEQPFLQRVRDIFQIQQPLAVFFSRRDHGRRMFPACPADLGDVPAVVFVVVGEFEMSDDLVCVAKVHAQRCVLRDTREQNDFLGIGVARIRFLEDRFQRAVVDGGEEQRLFRALPVRSPACLGAVPFEAEGFRPPDLLLVLQVVRTFGDHDDVGVVQSLRKVAQPAEGSKLSL